MIPHRTPRFIPRQLFLSLWVKSNRKRLGIPDLQRDASPFRYPGGKGALKYLLALILITAKKNGRTLVEPYCGGAGATLPLLYAGIIDRLVLNDLNYGLYCFWKSALKNTNKLIEELQRIQVSVSNWKKWRDAYKNPRVYSELEVGLSTFMLNRCNRSGLLDAGPIGGINQLGPYPINCRFNRNELIRRVSVIASHKSRIHIYNNDGVQFMKNIERRISIDGAVYLDPPFIRQGYNLYRNYSFLQQDHIRLAQYICHQKYFWIASYDKHPFVSEFFGENSETATVELSYMMHTNGNATEYLVAGGTAQKSLKIVMAKIKSMLSANGQPYH